MSCTTYIPRALGVGSAQLYSPKRQKWISDSTMQVVAQRAVVRRAKDLAVIAASVGVDPFPGSIADGKSQQQLGAEIKALSRSIATAIKQDKVAYATALATQAREVDDRGDSKTLYALIRRMSPYKS